MGSARSVIEKLLLMGVPASLVAAENAHPTDCLRDWEMVFGRTVAALKQIIGEFQAGGAGVPIIATAIPIEEGVNPSICVKTIKSSNFVKFGPTVWAIQPLEICTPCLRRTARMGGFQRRQQRYRPHHCGDRE